MKIINIIVEGRTEEAFVNEALRDHFARFEKYVYCRKILTGWDSKGNKPSKGGLSNYMKFRNDVTRWIVENDGRNDVFFSSFIDLYAFPKDKRSPYSKEIQGIKEPYAKVLALENALKADINCPFFIPYIQLHEFETFILVAPERLKIMYPDKTGKINLLKKEIADLNVEYINDTPQKAPSKRIIKYISEYKAQKAQVGPLVAADIGIKALRKACRHFDEWMTTIENI